MVNGESLECSDLAHDRVHDRSKDWSPLLYEGEVQNPQRHGSITYSIPTLYHAHNIDDAGSERSSSTASGSSKCYICRKRLPMETTSLIQCFACQRRYHKGCHKPAVLFCNTSWCCYLCSARRTTPMRTSANGAGNSHNHSNSPPHSLDSRHAKRRRLESSHHSPRLALSEQRSHLRLQNNIAEPVSPHSTLGQANGMASEVQDNTCVIGSQPMLESADSHSKYGSTTVKSFVPPQTSLDGVPQPSHSASIGLPSVAKSVAEVIRETKQPEFTVMSLYDEYPEYRPNARMSSHAYESAGRVRPSRKQVFGKQCPSATLKNMTLGMQRCREQLMQRKRAEEHSGHSALGQQKTNEEHENDMYDSIESLIGLPESVVPIIHDNQLLFQKCTQVIDGDGQRRPIVVHKSGAVGEG